MNNRRDASCSDASASSAQSSLLLVADADRTSARAPSRWRLRAALSHAQEVPRIHELHGELLNPSTLPEVTFPSIDHVTPSPWRNAAEPIQCHKSSAGLMNVVASVRGRACVEDSTRSQDVVVVV